MDTKIRWLKASFLAGAIADGLIGIMMLIPSRMGETEFRYPMGLAATLMFGWTVLLIWGYQKPVERRGILLITIFPVIAGLVANALYQFAIGSFPLARVLPYVILGGGLIVLMGYSSLNARSVSDSS
jgi:hypothetical protein